LPEFVESVVDPVVATPRLTTPLDVTLPGVAVVCAAAGNAIAIANGAA
jgi:hypothetical protein